MYSLRSDEEIQQTLQSARNDALVDVSKFGMNVDVEDIIRCEIRGKQIQKKTKKNLMKSDNSDEACEGRNPDLQNVVDIDSQFVEVLNIDGTSRTVLKSSLVWVLSETKGVLSNDRLRRVQGQSGIPTKRKNIVRKDMEVLRRDKCSQARTGTGAWGALSAP